MTATKEKASRIAIAAVSLLILMKIIASILTGSIAIRADAIHSLIDLLGVVTGYIGIKISRKPPDKQHAFGHGKAENIAGSIISGLIFIAAGTILYEAIKRLITGGAVELLTVGIYVTAAAIVINLVTSRYVMKVARTTDSIALEASARDLFADVLSSGAVLVGLLVVNFTGVAMLDSIVAIIVAGLIIKTAYQTMRKSVGGLMDTRLPESEEEIISSCFEEHRGQIIGFHAVRTRQAGSQRFVDLHLVVPQNMSVEAAHRMCDQLENGIEERLPNTSITIHVEPCGGNCKQCQAICDLRPPEPSP